MKAYLKNNVIVGFYNGEPHAPKDCETLDLTTRADIPLLGYIYDEETDTFSQPKPHALEKVPLDVIALAACDIIDEEASVAYNNIIGSMHNKLALYTAKYHDAKAYKLQVYGDAVATYKWVASEVSATGKKAEEVADMFIEKYSALVDIMTKVEELRVYGKSMVRAATKIEEVREARSHAITELRALI